MPEDGLPILSIGILDLPMPLMDKQARNRARPSIHVLVGTPGGKIDVPVMQPERHVSRRVRQVPADS